MDVQGEMKAVVPGVGLDFAKRIPGKPPVVLAEEALPAFVFDKLKGHQHEIFDLFIGRYIEMV